MKYLKILVLMTLLCTEQTLADWAVSTGTGSYMGAQHYGISYSSNTRHSTLFSYGKTPGKLASSVEQLNVQYVYSPFEYVKGDFSSNILGIGVLVSRCLCDEMFIKNSGVYPEENYYDETTYRFGIVLSSRVKYQSFELYLDWTLLDQVAIAIYNNDRFAHKAAEYWTSGIGVKYYF